MGFSRKDRIISMMMRDRIISYSGNDYGVREVHNLLLPFLEKLEDHCRKYQIPYSLAFGSTLGCVRHNGFIPWDDDVDIVMKRADYERFFESLKPGDTVFSKGCRIEFPRHLCKLCDNTSTTIPIFVDLYPADLVPNGRMMRHLKIVAVQMVKNIIIGRCGKKNTLFRKLRKTLAYAISFPFSKESLRNCFQTISQWGNNSSADRISCYSTGRGDMGKYFPSKIFDDIIYRKFEDIKLPIMADFHTYLTIEFGEDYMTPPSKDKRVPKHLGLA